MAKAVSVMVLSTLAASVKVNTLNIQTGAERSFSEFQARFGKNYDTLAEFNYRMTLWKKTDDFIKASQPKSYTLGHNKFSDWTPEERKRLLGFKPDGKI